MDAFAHRMAALLVGNDERDAALEITLVGPSIVFERETLIALTGADLTATIDGRAMRLWRAAVVQEGTTLSFAQARAGCRAYLAVAGGIDVPLVLGSRSTYIRAGLGGMSGRALRGGDVLNIGTPPPLSMRIGAALRQPAQGSVAVGGWGAGASMRPAYTSAPTIRLIEGSHTRELSPNSRTQLTDGVFRLSPHCDRQGFRLEGPTLELMQPLELISEAVTFGTMQLPPGGAPIILMADRQTTGGYPRIANVATVDLPLMAQLKPGDSLRFTFISLDEAQRLYLAREREITQVKRAIELRHAH